MIRPRIVIASDFSLTLNVVTEPYEEGLFIKSSNLANPCVITTILPHQLATNDRVKIAGHRDNTVVNGKQTVTVIDALNFSVPVIGVIIGNNAGRVSKCVNIAGYTFSVRLLNQSGGSAITTAVPILTTLIDADGEFKVVISKAKTGTLKRGIAVIEVTYTDANNITTIRTVECEVKYA